MTHDLAVARTCRTLTLLALTLATWSATHNHWWLAAGAAYTMPCLLLVDAASRHAYRRDRQPDHDTRSSR